MQLGFRAGLELKQAKVAGRIAVTNAVQLTSRKIALFQHGDFESATSFVRYPP